MVCVSCKHRVTCLFKEKLDTGIKLHSNENENK